MQATAEAATQEGYDPARLVDVERYRILDLDAPAAHTLIARCRAELRTTGACVLPGFLSASGLARMADEARLIAPFAHWGAVGPGGTAYLEPPDTGFPEDHPRRRLQPSSVGAVAYDLIPPNHALRRLYEWDGLMAFIERVVDRGRLYRYTDPLGALNVAVMRDGDRLLWHYDQTDFVTSILLHDCEAGGAFEYVPMTRQAGNENYDRVARLLDGDRSEVVKLDIRPGTFVFFEGRHSIHRVSPIEGGTDRHIALLGYDTRPDTRSSERLRMRRYGRLG